MIEIGPLSNSRRGVPHVPSYEEIEERLRAFEEDERARLGLVENPTEHWHDPNPQVFRKRDRADTTILLGGLTLLQDAFVSAALEGIGYRVAPLDVPDSRALHLGKEFGNRGQCNPTYFTVGNLVKHLSDLRDGGLSVERIVKEYVFMTAGACGPCRFGTYATEYRKALRDAGFDGFRVLLFQQMGGVRQATGDDAGLELRPIFFWKLLTAIVAGDVLNMIGYRTRPYEREAGATDRALAHAREIVCSALRDRRSVARALRRSARALRLVEVDRLEARPRVLVIGEFWAMTTEGAGNYRLQRFLESEGAEVEIQPVTAWILYMIWQARHDIGRRIDLRRDDVARRGLAGKSPRRILAKLRVAEWIVRAVWSHHARAVGLEGAKLPDMDEIARLGGEHYDLELRGGEGHMEVGKLVQAVERRKAHMVVSVKPFGCMPSSAVSDGVQAAVIARYPEAIFCPVETTGDGEVNFQSRVLMSLFKARRRARDELARALESRGLDAETARARAPARYRCGGTSPPHRVAGTAANIVLSLGKRP